MGNTINEFLNDKVIAMQAWLLAHPFAGQRDIIAAYSSLTVVYDPMETRRKVHPQQTVFDWVKQYLQTSFEQSVIQPAQDDQLIRIPVCYDAAFGTDLSAMAVLHTLDIEEIIILHTAHVYRVYTIGFLPGFSYMASVDKKLVTPRKLRPEMVTAGSVGIAGEQTGIYPLNSPGGWHIIGRTPVKQFDPDSKELVKLKVGNRVMFYRIGMEQYEDIERGATM